MNTGSVTRVLTVLAAVLCFAELGSSIVIWRENYPDSQPAFAVLFALLFLLGFWLLRRGRATAGAVLVGVLCLFEVVSFPGWTRHNAFDWINQIGVALVALVALGVAIAVLVGRRRSASAAVSG